MKSKGTIASVTRWIAATSALLVALSFPLGYFIYSYKYLAGTLEAEAEVNAFFVAGLVRENPDLWRYEQHRLEDLLERRTRNGYAETRRLFDSDNKLIAESSNQLRWPQIRRSREIVDAGVVVASVEISRSLHPLLGRTLLIALLGVSIGLLVYLALRVLPIRAVMEAEEQLRRSNEELQASNEELSNFTTLFFHDLRTPLVNLKGFSSELRVALEEVNDLMRVSLPMLDDSVSERLGLVLQREVPEALHFIDTSVHKMDVLFTSVLTMLHFGRRSLKPEKIDMEELVRSVLAGFAGEIEKQGMKVTVHYLPQVVADKTFMRLIISHLIDNAVKYQGPGREGELEVSAEMANDQFIFHIRDNGRGIAEEEMQKVFELFRRGGKQDTKGEGMGLPYVKTLVRRLGGRIWCESEPGVGSTFSFTIAANC